MAFKHQPGREAADCAIAALSTYLGVRYEEVLRAVAVEEAEAQGRQGLTGPEIGLVAETLGQPIKLVCKQVDLEHDEGLLMFDDHVCVLYRGLIFDADGFIYDAEEYCDFYPSAPYGIMAKVGGKTIENRVNQAF